jgi:hypothetical protein
MKFPTPSPLISLSPIEMIDVLRDASAGAVELPYNAFASEARTDSSVDDNAVGAGLVTPVANAFNGTVPVAAFAVSSTSATDATATTTTSAARIRLRRLPARVQDRGMFFVNP